MQNKAPFDFEVRDPQRVVGGEVLLHACPSLVLVSLFSRPALLAAFVDRILDDINYQPMSILMFHISIFNGFFL